MKERRTEALNWLGKLVGVSRQMFICISVLFFVSFLLVTFTPVGTIISVRLMESTALDKLPQADAIVVLGGDLVRAADAIRVYRAGKAPMIVISGKAEEPMRTLLADSIPSSVVKVDEAPERTVNHPITIRTIEGIDSSSRLIIISSALQQRRALRLFRRAGYKNVWVCSWEWDRYLARDERKRLPNPNFMRILYELGAWVKELLIN